MCIHPGAIGDIVLALPALDGLVARGDWHVTAACMGDRATLVSMAGIAAESINIDTGGLWRVLAQPQELAEPVRRFISSFDSAIVWMSDTKDIISSALTDCGLNPIVVAPAVPPAGWQSHASRYYVHTLASFGVPPVCDILQLDPNDDAKRWARTFLDGNVDRTTVIHPGSGARQKRWPIDRFARVAAWLRDRAGMRIVWMTGPAEDHADIDFARGPNDTHVCDVPLHRMAALLKSSDLYIGNDSGPTHCAAAVGTRTVALFGPTDPAVWGPVGDHTVIVRGKSSCAPCRPDQRRACTDTLCMDKISVTDVLMSIGPAIQYPADTHETYT